MGMLKEGVRLDRVRGGRQKYRNRMRIVGQASINRAEAYSGNIDGRRENDQGYHMSSVPYPTGGEEKIPVIKTLAGNNRINIMYKSKNIANLNVLICRTTIFVFYRNSLSVCRK